VALVAVVCVAASCGGGGGGGTTGGAGSTGMSAAVVLPSVPAGDHEAACASLCTLAAGETICTAKHAEYCLDRCRVITSGLPAACASCVLGTGATPIAGFMVGTDSYCGVGGPAKLSDCASDCDDHGGGQPDPDLEALCELECGFYFELPKPFACPAASSADCLTGCRSAIASKERICAQCLAEHVLGGQSCINDACTCESSFHDESSAFASECTTLCDFLPAN
jgi:hypothetical protein